MKKLNLISMIVILLTFILLFEGCFSQKEDSYLRITCEVPIVELIKTLSNNSEDSIFNAALHKTKLLQNGNQDDLVVLFGKVFEELDSNARLAAIFVIKEFRDQISFNSTNAEVLKVIDSLVSLELENAYQVIWNRINNYGFKRAKVKKLEVKGRFQIELPGIKKSKEVLSLFQTNGLLEFWETFENSEIYPYLLDANEIIKKIDEKSNNTQEVNEETLSKQATKTNSLLEELDTVESQNSNYNIEEFKNEYQLFSILTPNVSQEGNFLTGPVVGLVNIRDTGKINNILALEYLNSVFPRELKFCWTAKPVNTDYLQLIALKTDRQGQAALNGKVIISAKQEYDEYTNQPIVIFNMNARGSIEWSRLTKENIGKSIAIVLDDKVLSFPTVGSQIVGGQSSISGPMSLKEAADLAALIKSGSMYVPLRIIDIKEVVSEPK